MTAPLLERAAPRPSGAPAGPRAARRATRWAALVGAAVLLVVLVLVGLSVGSHAMPLGRTWSLLLHPDGSAESAMLHDLRLPRTLVALVVGAALGLAGSLMQQLTRNPLADPGILGVNAGAGFAVVLAVALLGVHGVSSYVWFAFGGAALAAVAVTVLGAIGGRGATPVRLALAGVAVGAALTALTQTVVLADQTAFNEFRFWVVGSLEGRGWPVLGSVVPFIGVGAVLALALGPSLDAMSLGDEAGTALGVRVARTRALTIVAITVLCGAATAAIGPVSFVGLAVPFVARALVGTDQRWVGALCLLLGPAWLLGADVLARVVVAPQEVPVGVVAALVGAPFFVALVRRRSVAAP
ncbi:iron ABC transporter permease [Cellulomonas sp. HZM]|uniref:FecCD family ABC transporter permease n=1 Tax=Cellulomonas sp. HZM TaxID=1454010 RepID=UPI00054E5176|nr:iron chelate uptake ABC transporter family permease subunit [Cellulomonas sp. HZM]